MRKIFVYPDVQIPYHNSDQVRALNRFLGYWEPDEVIVIGDFMDFPQPSSWSKATAAEYQGSVLADCAAGERILTNLRYWYDGPISFIEGNHDARPRTYLNRYAPALAESNAFNIDKLLNFDNWDIDLVEPFYPFAPGWVATHGHLGITLSQVAGRTALGAARRIGQSVVCGHTHRLAKVPDTYGRAGDYHTLWGVEVGHVMDMRAGNTPAWLKGGFANWQSGFGLFYQVGEIIHSEIVPMENDGSFVFEGEKFTAEGRVSV